MAKAQTQSREKIHEQIRQACVDFIEQIYPDQSKIVVFGEGNLSAKLMLVGEAPGEQETLRQRPFVGSAGKNLDRFLELVHLEREALYISNTVKFRPTKRNEKTGRLSNRPPEREEVLLCTRFLREEINLVSPRVIASLGNVALRALAGDRRLTIGAEHGRPRPCQMAGGGVEFILFPLYHPASVIYNNKLKETYEQDVAQLAQYLKERV